MSSKYDPLQTYLKAQSGAQVSMSFAEIERLIGCKLPPSARKHRPWWSNNPSNSVITKAWLNASYRTAQVDMQGECLVFCRQSARGAAVFKPTAGQPSMPNSVQDSGAVGNGYRQSFYGCMKGMITIADDCDLTASADPDWHRQSEQA